MEKQKYIVKVSYVKYYEVLADDYVKALNVAVYEIKDKGINPSVFNEVHAEILEPSQVPQETLINKNNL